jgi:bacterioferritin
VSGRPTAIPPGEKLTRIVRIIINIGYFGKCFLKVAQEMGFSQLGMRCTLAPEFKFCGLGRIEMKGSSAVIAALNAQLKNELTAINQYFLHSRIFGNWGLEVLKKKEYEESIGEMKHADKLIERVLMLDGLPNLQDLGKLMIGENTREILESDLKMESAAQVTIKDGIAVAEAEHDYVSRDLLKEILEDTEEHIDWLETQISLIDRVGLQNFEQSMIGVGG